MQVAGLNSPEDIDESLFAVGQNVQDLYALKLVDSMVEKPNREVECEHGLYVGLDEMDPTSAFPGRS